MRQELHWVPASKFVPMAEKPTRVWTLSFQEEAKPDLPFAPKHGVNAFLEDEIHDWKWSKGQLKYYSRLRDHSVWILCEFGDDLSPPKS